MKANKQVLLARPHPFMVTFLYVSKHDFESPERRELVGRTLLRHFR